jgi:hypothetical protein
MIKGEMWKFYYKFLHMPLIHLSRFVLEILVMLDVQNWSVQFSHITKISTDKQLIMHI